MGTLARTSTVVMGLAAVAVLSPVRLSAGASADREAGSATSAEISAPIPEAVSRWDAEAVSHIIESALAGRYLGGADVGVLVVSATDGRVLYERDADRPLVPASNMKIVTSACALSILGPDYQFVTRVATDGERSGTIVHGNVYVRGSGDPSLVSEELWRLVEAIRMRGIERIAGDLVLDASYFDTVEVASEEAADGDRAYHARTSALALNFNAVAVRVEPGQSVGAPAVVTVSPEVGFFDVRTEATTCSGGRGPTIEVRRTFEGGRNVVTVTGRIPEDSNGMVFYRNVEHPTAYFGSAMADFLRRAGIALGGVVRQGRTPPQAVVLVEHESKPLALIVRDVGKFSNNVIAEQLLKALGAHEYGPPGTTESGVEVVSLYLESVGADSGSFRLVDGSGFSRRNRLSPRTIVRVVRDILGRFETSYEFVASLSVAGIDGTLEDRMDLAGLEGRVRAKTGLLDGVTAISGIMHTLAEDDLVFSIILNGFDCEEWRAHDLEQAILAELARSEWTQ